MDVRKCISLYNYDGWEPSKIVNTQGGTSMKLRKYRESDCEAIVSLFYDTVHNVNIRDYSEIQLNVWAPKSADFKGWNKSLLETRTAVAEIENVVVGFGNIDSTGYLDCLFVHKNHQGEGIATALCDALEATANGVITTHSSITAKPFFENRGYKLVRKQVVERQGVALINYVMEKNQVI